MFSDLQLEGLGLVHRKMGFGQMIFSQYHMSHVLIMFHSISQTATLVGCNTLVSTMGILYELQSKLLVSPLISPIVVPYIIPLSPFKEFRLQLICFL